MAWHLSKENTLEPILGMEKVNQGLCDYYEKNKENFSKFKEAKFLSGHKHLLMTYLEKVKKNP